MRVGGGQASLSVCGICSSRCGIAVEVVRDSVTRVRADREHPISGGAICPKGRALPEILDSPRRLRKPLVRRDGVLSEASWEEALSAAANGLDRARAMGGPESVAFHVGQAGVGHGFLPYVRHLACAFGTPNYSSAGSHCHVAKEMANEHTYGFLPEPDYVRSGCIILWGYNPQESGPAAMGRINAARARGARLIVVDPRTTPTARDADIHLQVRPGTDGALALGMIHILIRDGLHDAKFVEQWTVGFEQLAERAATFEPERVERITGVSAADLEAAAHLYATNRPAVLYPGIAVELQANGYHGIRAIACLQALVGDLEVPGGALRVPAPPLAPLGSPSVSGASPIGSEEFPLFALSPHGLAQANRYARAVLDGDPYPLKALVVFGANPLLTWPGGARLRDALAQLDSLVVIDHVLTETASMADVVLPAGSFLARPELWWGADSNGDLLIGLSEPLVDESDLMSDWEIAKAIAEKSGLGNAFPWADEHAAIDARLEPMGLSVEVLQSSPRGVRWGSVQYGTYEDGGFRTPSGKVELVSSRLAEAGHDPLPGYVPVLGDRAVEAPGVIVTTGARVAAYQHSRYRWVPALAALHPEPDAVMHPDTAAECGVLEGDRVRVTSAQGDIVLKAVFDDRVLRGAVSIMHGWDQANANLLTDAERLDPVSGFPGDRMLVATVEVAERSATGAAHESAGKCCCGGAC